MSWSVARELTRIATEENERAWLDLTRGRTVRQIEELVAGHKLGDRPEDAYDRALERHVLRSVFRHSDGTAYGQAVRPEVVAIREEAFRALRSLGFRESETRRALERVRASAHVGAASIQTILRQALALLVAK